MGPGREGGWRTSAGLSVTHGPFENRPDLADFRHGLFRTIDACPNLDFLLFTKRPHKIREFWLDGYRHNVWLVYSASEQSSLNDGLPHLLQCRDLVPILGLSAEPLLGPLDLAKFLTTCECVTCCNGDHPGACRNCAGWGSHNEENPCSHCNGSGTCPVCAGEPPKRLNWVIPGGESGPWARPCDLAWIRSINNQCRKAGVPVFVKQLGKEPRGLCEWQHHQEYPPEWLDEHGTLLSISGAPTGDLCHAMGDTWWPCKPPFKDKKGGNIAEWPTDLRVQEFPISQLNPFT